VNASGPPRQVAGVAPWKWGALLLGIVLLVLALVVRGSSSAAVARVAGTPITLSSFDSWLHSAAVSAHAGNKDLPPFAPSGGNLSRCMTFERDAASKGTTKTPGRAALRTLCRQYGVTLAEGVVEFLISAEWYLEEGTREHVRISASAVSKVMRSSFPHSSGLHQFLSSTGMNRSQARYEATVELTAERLEAAHAGATPTISPTQIASYYAANRSDIGKETLAQATPEIREVLVAQAQTPAVDSYMVTVEHYWQPRTSCSRGYRIAGYCRPTSRRCSRS
jgi:hypothetical protein